MWLQICFAAIQLEMKLCIAHTARWKAHKSCHQRYKSLYMQMAQKRLAFSKKNSFSCILFMLSENRCQKLQIWKNSDSGKEADAANNFFACYFTFYFVSWVHLNQHFGYVEEIINQQPNYLHSEEWKRKQRPQHHMWHCNESKVYSKRETRSPAEQCTALLMTGMR